MIRKPSPLARCATVVHAFLFGIFVPPSQVGARRYRSASRFASFEGLHGFLDHSPLTNCVARKQLEKSRSCQNVDCGCPKNYLYFDSFPKYASPHCTHAALTTPSLQQPHLTANCLLCVKICSVWTENDKPAVELNAMIAHATVTTETITL